MSCTCCSSEAGTGGRVSTPPPPGPLAGSKGSLARTTTSTPLVVSANSSSKTLPSVSVSTKVPAMKATPSTTESDVRTSRDLRANRFRSVTCVMSAAEPLHAVDDVVGGRAHELVHDLAVGEEHDAVGVAR